jgi:hypothetical protein
LRQQIPGLDLATDFSHQRVDSLALWLQTDGLITLPSRLRAPHRAG